MRTIIKFKFSKNDLVKKKCYFTSFSLLICLSKTMYEFKENQKKNIEEDSENTDHLSSNI